MQEEKERGRGGGIFSFSSLQRYSGTINIRYPAVFRKSDKLSDIDGEQFSLKIKEGAITVNGST